MGYVIRFDFGPDQVWYAGKTVGGSLGYAPTTETALVLDSAEIAERFRVNGYGGEVAKLGTVVELTEESSPS
jgi:hypothetical protein